MRTRILLCAAAAALTMTACGADDETSSQTTPAEPATAEVDLAAVKDYLLDHTDQLKAEVSGIREDAEAYYELAEAADFDYEALLQSEGEEIAKLIKSGQEGFQRANPAYEEMEGVVAGVPALAEFDVILDAGGDGSDPASAVPFDIETPAGETYEQPGNFFFLVETSLFGTEPKFAAEGIKPDLDGDGKVEFGEALPDADFLVAAARDFEEQANELDAAAEAYEPTLQDAMTALVVMTPTMSEYFEAWKNSRFVAGDDATESGFVAASRLQDIEDILSGLVLVYENVRPAIEEVDAQQASQTETALEGLRDFAGDLREEEKQGRDFTAQDADTLGTEAQNQAEAIAGQVSQAAGQLDIKLET